MIWFGELNFEDFIHWRHTKDEPKHSFDLFLHWFVLILLLRNTKQKGKKFKKRSTQAVAWPVSREYSCQLNGSFFTACIFCWDRASCLARSSANTLRIPVFKAYCHVQLTFYWEESPYRYPTGKSHVIQSLRFQSARFWVPFWNDAVLTGKQKCIVIIFFSICQNKCCFYQLSHFLYWYKLYPLICSAETTDVWQRDVFMSCLSTLVYF